MDHRSDQRPPRSARPRPSSQPQSPAAAHQEQLPQRPQFYPSDSSKAGVSFSYVEHGDRHGTVDPYRQRQPQYPMADPESDQFDPSRVGRKKSLVRPDREKIDPGHRQWHYRSHVAQLEEDGHGRVGVMPSSMSSSLHFSPTLLQLAHTTHVL